MNIQLQKAEPMGGGRKSPWSMPMDSAKCWALHGPIFEPAHAPDFFARLQIESDTIRWPNGADLILMSFASGRKKERC